MAPADPTSQIAAAAQWLGKQIHVHLPTTELVSKCSLVWSSLSYFSARALQQCFGAAVSGFSLGLFQRGWRQHSNNSSWLSSFTTSSALAVGTVPAKVAPNTKTCV